MRRPITQKAKSPLKETEEDRVGSSGDQMSGDVSLSRSSSTKEEDKIIPGKKTTVVDDYSKDWDIEAAGGLTYAEWIAKPGNKAKEDAFVASKTRTVQEPDQVIKGGTTTTEQQFTPQTADDYTGITPWENRFNMRTSRQSERFSRNEAKRDLRRNAKEAARDARQDGGSFLEGRQARRDIMTGKSFQNKRQENLYNTSRGLTDDQNTVYKTDMQKNQFDKGITRGEEFTGTPRDMTTYDVGTAKGQTTLNNYKASAPGFEVKLGANEKVTTSGGDAAKANSGAPTTNKVNGTGASSKAAMRPSIGLNAEFKGASVPSAPDLVAAKKARQVAQADATMPNAVTVTPKETNSKPRKTRAPKGEKELSKRQIRRQERKENTAVSTGKLGSDLSKSASIPTPEPKGASKLAPISAPKPSAGSNFAGTGMSKSELGDLSEALTDQKNAGVREANKFTAGSIQANTGTADRSSYNRTSPGLSDGTPTRKDSDRSVISAAQMRYESNVGIKKSTPMKKGYFKGK
jgi:hypothetical protein